MFNSFQLFRIQFGDTQFVPSPVSTSMSRVDDAILLFKGARAASPRDTDTVLLLHLFHGSHSNYPLVTPTRRENEPLFSCPENFYAPRYIKMLNCINKYIWWVSGLRRLGRRMILYPRLLRSLRKYWDMEMFLFNDAVYC
jgi:hypothetical protein